MRRECLKRCETGDYYIVYSKKTGKPYKKPYLRCEKCQQVFEKLDVEHIEPVVEYTGFAGWDIYINRLMVPSDKLSGWCKEDHKAHTAIQSELRKNERKKKKK